MLAGVAALSTACGTVAPVTARAGGTPKPDGASPGQHAAGPATGTSSAPAASTGLQQSCLPGQIGPIGASFVSAADGYLLGITLRDCSATVSSKVVLRKTADGGQHWTSLPAPPAPWGGVAPDGTGAIPADGVTSVLSANGGRTWSRPAVTDDAGATDSGAPVMADLFTNSDGYMIVAWRALWITRDGGGTWKPVTIH